MAVWEQWDIQDVDGMETLGLGTLSIPSENPSIGPG